MRRSKGVLYEHLGIAELLGPLVHDPVHLSHLVIQLAVALKYVFLRVLRCSCKIHWFSGSSIRPRGIKSCGAELYFESAFLDA
jgi:hypothetical protein